MDQADRDRFRQHLQREVAQRAAAKFEETRDTLHWRNAGQHCWYCATPLGRAYCVRLAERRWACGFEVQGGKEHVVGSLLEAKAALTQYLAEHDVPPGSVQK
jgi:hypothetical protein